MLDTITSRNNAKVLAAYSLRKDPTPEAFLVEGFHLCQMAFLLGSLKEVFALKDPGFPNVSTHLVNQSIIEKLAFTKSPEGIVGVASLPLNKPSSDLVLVLDRVQDPGNVGTLLRTALSFGFKEVHLLPGACSCFNPKVIAASQGAIFGVKLCFPSSEEEEIESLRSRGYAILGSSLQDAIPLEGRGFPEKKIALILGNEGQGMSKTLLAKTDDNLKITMSGIDSLNVGIAGGILMHSIASSK